MANSFQTVVDHMHQKLGYCRFLDLASGLQVSELWGEAREPAYSSEVKHSEEKCGDGPWEKGELKVLSVVVKACRHLIIAVGWQLYFVLHPTNCLSARDLLW